MNYNYAIMSLRSTLMTAGKINFNKTLLTAPNLLNRGNPPL